MVVVMVVVLMVVMLLLFFLIVIAIVMFLSLLFLFLHMEAVAMAVVMGAAQRHYVHLTPESKPLYLLRHLQYTAVLHRSAFLLSDHILTVRYPSAVKSRQPRLHHSAWTESTATPSMSER